MVENLRGFYTAREQRSPYMFNNLNFKIMKKEVYSNLLADAEKVIAATEYLTSERLAVVNQSDDKVLKEKRAELDRATANYNLRVNELVTSNVRNVFANYEGIRAAVKVVDSKFENGGFIEWFDMNHKEIAEEPLCVTLSQVASHVKSLHDSYYVAKGIASANKKKRVSLEEKRAASKENFLSTLSEEGRAKLEELMKSGIIK